MLTCGADQETKMSHWFHVQNQHTDTFLAPAVDMLIILAAPQPPKYQDHQWIGSQFKCHNVSSVSAAPQQPKCQKHQRIDRRLFAVCRALAGSGRTARKYTNIRRALTTSEGRAPQRRSHEAVQLPFPGFLDKFSIRESRSYWTAGGSRVGIWTKNRDL